jgi:hypothetical protein
VIEMTDLTPIDEIPRGDPDDEDSLRCFADRARSFLIDQSWCNAVKRGWLGVGWDGVLGVFFFEIEPARPNVDHSVWVIAGDVPSAYICNDIETPKEALESYMDEMCLWIDAVRAKKPVDELIPVNAPATAKFADMLASRLDFIRKELLPEC